MKQSIVNAAIWALLLVPLLAAPVPAASQAGGGGGAVVVRQSLCKISVGQTLPGGTDEVYTFDCSTVLTPSATGVSTLRAKATVEGWPGGTYRNTGFACIINTQPAGGGSVCTTNSRVVVNAAGQASLNCQCKLTDPRCRPLAEGETSC
ncbi:MAG: hypothetical protein U0S49_06800 [Rhodospirillales bacterium]|nr:hypothetical protein [Rhodospirillales bacterium]